MDDKRYGDPRTELAALTRLLEYAHATAADLDQSVLAGLIQVATNESIRAAGATPEPQRKRQKVTN